MILGTGVRVTMSSSRSVRSRRVIGLLESQLDRGFHRAALLGVSAAARAAGADLVSFDGGVVAREASSAAMPNVLYDLVGPANVDGLIIWASALDWELSAEQMETFCRRFAPLPVVTVGRLFEGLPSVLVDNYQGMREAARHLIRDHGFTRLAFLRGPEGSEEEELRFRGYRDALAERGIPFDPALVSSRTNWMRPDGPVVVAELLDRRGLRPAADFEAILAVGDDMACGAIEALRGRGVRVPDDIAVVGFNDDEEGRSILPALTTVAQPVAEMGAAAVNLLMDLLAERSAPASITLPLDLVVRRSCGCLSPGVLPRRPHCPAPNPRPLLTPERLQRSWPAGPDFRSPRCANSSTSSAGKSTKATPSASCPASTPGFRRPRSIRTGAATSRSGVWRSRLCAARFCRPCASRSAAGRRTCGSRARC